MTSPYRLLWGAPLALALALLLLVALIAFAEGRGGRAARRWTGSLLDPARAAFAVVLAGAALGTWGALGWGALLLAPPLIALVGELLPWHVGARLRGQTAGHGDDEPLHELIEQGRESGTLRATEHDLIARVLAFDELSVGRLMTPRREMFSVSLDQPFPELLETLREAGYSRVPVWEGSRENIIGVLIVKDLLAGLVGAGAGLGTTPRQLRRMLRPARFVPATRRAVDMLAELRANRLHLALVVDEHGTVIGLITLDDLLGELVGELPDEMDEEPDPLVRRAGERTWLVNASMDAGDFAERFGLELPDGEYNTVGGMVIQALGDLAHEGDSIPCGGGTLTVRRVEGRRVADLLLEIPAASGGEEGG